jgi:crotonobetainyl-CoA:carnitine CoA-transferase CaiB-like acyl-CoA transferase
MKPLKGVKVIDFTTTIAGPFCGCLLADYGAEVYKVERPGRGEDARLFPPQKEGVPLGFVSIGRGKKGLTMDLNKPEGQELFRKLAAKVDVILENYTPGTMKRWNIDYETIKAFNPKIVYCSISGFGQFGPLSPLPGYDAVIQAMSGMMMSTGFPDGAPTRTGNASTDYLTGTFGALGIAMGILQARTTGKGMHLDVAMLDCVLNTQDVPFLSAMNLDQNVPRYGNRLPYVTPFDTFRTKDGWLMIATANNNNFGGLAKVMGREDLMENPKFSDNMQRCMNEAELREIIAAWTKDIGTMELMGMLMKNGVPCAPIQHAGQMLKNPHAQARGLVQEVTQPNGFKVKVPGVAIKIDGQILPVEGNAPDPGQHNAEVLGELLGMGEADLVSLKEKGII